MYKAIVCKIKNLQKHPNADRLQIGKAHNYDVIVSLDIKEGDLGVFFPCDGQLSHELCYNNNLYQDKSKNKDPEAKGGFFSDNRRVRAINLRGARSEGFWSPVSIFDWLEQDVLLKEGQMFDVLVGIDICNKYVTPATMKRQNNKPRGRNELKLKDQFPDFKKHFSTNHLKAHGYLIPDTAFLIITEKMHGTSARTGKLQKKKNLNRFQKFWNRTFNSKYPKYEYGYVTGSRNVTFRDGGTGYRQKYHNLFMEDDMLLKGETVYYEIVGYDENDRGIMSAHGVKGDELKQRYGNKVDYSYGCQRKSEVNKGCETHKPQNDIYVYRITSTLDDGTVVELPWYQVEKRCEQMNIKTVPVLDKFIYNGVLEELIETCEEMSVGDSTIDSKHLREGVVVRIEHKDRETSLKHKSFDFLLLEDRHKEKDEADEEESN